MKGSKLGKLFHQKSEFFVRFLSALQKFLRKCSWEWINDSKWERWKETALRKGWNGQYEFITSLPKCRYKQLSDLAAATPASSLLLLDSLGDQVHTRMFWFFSTVKGEKYCERWSREKSYFSLNARRVLTDITIVPWARCSRWPRVVGVKRISGTFQIGQILGWHDL